MNTTAEYALLSDGTESEIRLLGPDDHDAVKRMHEELSQESRYMRFFGLSSRSAADTADLCCRVDGSGHLALGAWVAGELVGVAGYEPDRRDPRSAELAIAVADRMHHRGVGTLLLEHLASRARLSGITELTADVLPSNHSMLRVIRDAGLEVHSLLQDGVTELVMPVAAGERYLDASGRREQLAEAASLAHVLRPFSAVVVGAGRKPGSVGRAVLRNLKASGFEGPVYVVNPGAVPSLLGAPCVATVADLPEAVELAVLAVPAAGVAEVARECGRRGVRALVVLTAGLSKAEAAELRSACHRYGMRLVGPNCLGVADATSGLDATFAQRRPRPGGAGIAVQSGGVGIALMEQLSRIGVGVSSFVSLGDKYDVSATDLLCWWEYDESTKVGIVYLESFGNPRKFSRVARRVGRKLPLLAVVAGRSAAGIRAAASHTAAGATPTVTREALFEQAGIVATRDLGELVAAAALLATQPAPGGPRVGIVSNAGGAGVLAADACTEAGLTVAVLSDTTRELLEGLLPETAACGGPVDTTAVIASDTFARCVAAVAADAGVDSVLAVLCPTSAEVLEWVTPATAGAKPMACVVLDQAEAVRLDGGGIPSYAYPEDAARALGRAWQYARLRDRPAGRVPDLTGVDEDAAHSLIEALLARSPEGGWLPPAETMAVLGAYGIPVAKWRWAAGQEEAAAAFTELGGQLAVKAQVSGVVHKSKAHAVLLGISSEREMSLAYTRFTEEFGDALEGVLVQRMERGLELLCGIVQEPVFGPLVVFGLGGTATDALADRTVRLTPLTDRDAAEMTGAIRASALLTDPLEPVDRAALHDILLRLGRLADDHPELAELDLNPVLAGPDGAVAVDARIRVLPARRWDPYLPRLR